MKTQILSIALLALAFTSCDKAKELVNKAGSAVKEKIATKAIPKGAATDESLQKLVDQTPEGVIFRKDLTFPSHLEVRITRNREISGRFFQNSALGKSVNAVNGTQISIIKLERTDDQVKYTSEQSSFTVPSTEKGKDPRKIVDPLEQVAPSSKPITFIKTSNTWKSADTSEFHAMVLSKTLGPVFEDLLIENALAPHSLWFGKHRMKIGDELDITGESVPMLLPGNAKGKFHLKLESLDAVSGHPCGVFTVTGDYTRKQVPNFEGGFTDEEVSIESGKIWLSLLYPVILREDLNTIQTFENGGQGGLTGHGQGTIKLSVKREWKSPAK